MMHYRSPGLLWRPELAKRRLIKGIFNLQDWMRIGAMNRLAEVGRVTPCAPSLALQETVVAAVGAQRTARPTFGSWETSFRSAHALGP